MSKLFDTLEKIQEQEASSSSPSVKKAAKLPLARKTSRYFPFLLGLTLIVAIVAAGQYLPFFKKNLSRQLDKIKVNSPAAPQTPNSQTSHAGSRTEQGKNLTGQTQIEYFNNHAVTLNDQGDAWAALYYFDKASKLAPQQPEPLINMAIILAQMDLGFPAGRIFQKAYQLAPDNEHLLQGLELAITDQVLPPDFFETLPLPGMDVK